MAIGDPARAEVVADADATVVRRMREAGAILLGKTNCPPYGGGIETDNPVYGRTEQPLRPRRARRAAAAAARRRSSRRAGSPLGLGTDSGRQRAPAGALLRAGGDQADGGPVPVTGVIDDEGQIGALGDPRTQVGPLARSVADVALALRVIAGARRPRRRRGARRRSGIRVRSTSRAARRALLGGWTTRAPARRRSPRSPRRPRRAARRGGRRGGGAAAAAGTTSRSRSGRPTAARALGLYRLLRRWDAFRARMLAWGDRYDLLLSPSSEGPAPPHGELVNRDGGRPDGLHDAVQPHRLAGRDGALRHVARRACRSACSSSPRRGATTSRSRRARLERALGGWRPADPWTGSCERDPPRRGAGRGSAGRCSPPSGAVVAVAAWRLPTPAISIVAIVVGCAAVGAVSPISFAIGGRGSRREPSARGRARRGPARSPASRGPAPAHARLRRPTVAGPKPASRRPGSSGPFTHSSTVSEAFRPPEAPPGSMKAVGGSRLFKSFFPFYFFFFLPPRRCARRCGRTACPG